MSGVSSSYKPINLDYKPLHGDERDDPYASEDFSKFASSVPAEEPGTSFPTPRFLFLMMIRIGDCLFSRDVLRSACGLGFKDDYWMKVSSGRWISNPRARACYQSILVIIRLPVLTLFLCCKLARKVEYLLERYSTENYPNIFLLKIFSSVEKYWDSFLGRKFFFFLVSREKFLLL